MFGRITFNLVGARKRYETLAGRQYLVVPTVALTEGVHNGSQGPLYYPPEELSRNPGVWNHKPIVLYHPTLNGNGISACDPQVVEQQGVGIIFNSTWDGRLRSESWLDEEKLKRVDNRVLEAINDGKMVEVSTGLFHDREDSQGEWNGEKYTGIVRNIQPDHLAILPDEKGACSIEDGAGLLRNAESADLSYDDIRQQASGLLRPDRPKLMAEESYSWVCEIFPKYLIYEKGDKSYKQGYKVKAGKVTLDGEPEEVRKVTSYVTANGQSIHTTNEDHQGPVKVSKPAASDLSDPMRKQQMQRALQEKYSSITQEGDWGGWVTDLFANYVVWSKDGKLFRLPYTYDDDKINFDGEPEEVERVSEYRTRRQTPIDGTQSPYNVNKDSSHMTVPTQTRNVIHEGAAGLVQETPNTTKPAGEGDRKSKVDKMITHGWAEGDRKFLMDLPEEGFEKIHSYVLRGATQPVVPYTYEGIGDRSSVHAHNQQISTEQYVAGAPPEIREVLTNALAAQAEEKVRLVKAIISNKGNRFNEKWLTNQTLPMLRGLAHLAGHRDQQTTNYSGQAEVPMFLDAVTTNAGDQQNTAGDEILPIPIMNWESERKAR